MWTVLLVVACASPSPSAEPYQIAAASPPARWLVVRLAGEVAVSVEGTPLQAELDALAGSDVVVANGAGYEPWLGELPDRIVLDTSDGLDLIPGDPRTWTDPETYLLQARALYDHIGRANGEDRAIYDEGLAALERDLEALDAAYAAALAPARGRPVAATAPAWGYLARHYGLELTVVAPDAVSDWAERTGGAVVLWTDPPPALAPGLRYVRLDTLEAGDYLAAAKGNARALAAAFTATP